MNSYLIIFLVILLVEALVSTILSYWYMGQAKIGDPWYIPDAKKDVNVGVQSNYSTRKRYFLMKAMILQKSFYYIIKIHWSLIYPDAIISDASISCQLFWETKFMKLYHMLFIYLEASFTVNQLLFACEKILRRSREPHRHEYFSSWTKYYIWYVINILLHCEN
jgi:hypothetical protein